MQTAAGILSPVLWPEMQAFARHLAAFAPVDVTPGHGVTTRMEAGEIALHWRAGMARITLQSPGLSGLQNLRDTLAHLLDSAREGLSAGLAWHAGAPEAGALPPNFREGRVISVERITPRFQRLRIAAEDPGFLARGGLHLRLLQPADPARPAWPRLSANGRTLWPAASALRAPVYTIRAIDAAAGWLEVDVFLHGKGPTCGWAAAARPGTLVGLTGPGGGWLPDAGRLCLGGDETALPVIARILETAALGTRGAAVIAVADAAEIQPLAAPPGLRLTWLCRNRDDGPLTGVFLAEARRCGPAAAVIFAAERAQAQAVRGALRPGQAAGTRAEGPSVAAYWTQTAPPD